jgi:hypothetical protein
MTELEQARATLESAAVEYAIAKLRNGTTPPPVDPPPVDPPPVDPPVIPPTAKPEHWAPFLDQLGVQLMRRNGDLELVEAWAIVNGSWEANQELNFPGVPQWAWDRWVSYNLGGDTHVYGIVLDKNGVVRTDVPFTHWWGPGAADGQAVDPEPSGWANSKMGASGQPTGTHAPRHWFPAGGDKLTNIWLPFNRHVTVFGVWQER